MKLKLMRFTAGYCQPCKQLAKSLETVELPVPVEVVDIETDQGSDLVEQYGVRGVPTLLLINEEDGEVVKAIVGVKPAEFIKNWVEEEL